jgi:integrase
VEKNGVIGWKLLQRMAKLLRVIAAQLGHQDTRKTEKHYAHLAPSYVADTIRAQFPRLGIADQTSVIPMNRKVG